MQWKLWPICSGLFPPSHASVWELPSTEIFLRFTSNTSVISQCPPPSTRSTLCHVTLSVRYAIVNAEKKGVPSAVLHNISTAILKTFLWHMGVFANVHSGYFVLRRLMEKHRLRPPAVVAAGCGAGDRRRVGLGFTFWWRQSVLNCQSRVSAVWHQRNTANDPTQHHAVGLFLSTTRFRRSIGFGVNGFGVNTGQLVFRRTTGRLLNTAKSVLTNGHLKKEMCDEISPSNTQDKQNTLLHFLDCHGDADESVSNTCSFGLKKDW